MKLTPQVEFTQSQVRQLKEFYEDFFDAAAKSGEAKALGEETADAFKHLVERLDALNRQTVIFPFLKILDEPLAKLKQLVDKPFAFYLSELPSQVEDLLDMKEQIFDPVRSFMHGPQKEIYQDAIQFSVQQRDNFGEIDGEEAKEFKQILNDPNCFKNNQIAKGQGADAVPGRQHKGYAGQASRGGGEQRSRG